MPRLRSALAVPVALLLAVAPAASVHAQPAARAEGSVPSEVRAYVADGSLVAQLNDVYGVDADGDGIDFDDTTKPGVIERVHVWSAELRDGEETDHPVDLLNEWIVPMTIAEEPVGLATVWINPETVTPELASFVADPELATALAVVPDGSSLVHDVESAAWLALAADGTLTPLVPGSTGLSTPVPIDDVAILPAAGGAPVAGGDPGTGVGFAIAVVLLLLAVIVVALIVPGLRQKKKDDASVAADAAAEDADVVAAPEVLEPAVAPKALEAAAEKPEKPEKPAKPATPKKKKAPPTED
ncbi:hypothetical protein [Pseudolysinimonas sp.]|jgi:hypothetical protein|uniref:hypothetical protein n=1 Tax=Pseudolysinimonas sp. TaxID=2680009 RepID=UPI003782ECCC